MDFSSYPPLYLSMLSLATWLPLPKLYAIKAISLVFDYVAAFLVFQIVRQRFPHSPYPLVAGTVVLFLPTVFLNSAVWGQCDVIYTSALLATVLAFLKGRTGWALAAFGIACALKPQAIFLAPLLGGLFFRELSSWKAAFKWILIPPAVYLLCGLPATGPRHFRGIRGVQ
jgi:Gpi18-like mannosyltransferase